MGMMAVRGCKPVLLERKGSLGSRGACCLPTAMIRGLAAHAVALLALVIHLAMSSHYRLLWTMGPGSVYVTVVLEHVQLISPEALADPTLLKIKRHGTAILNHVNWAPSMREVRDVTVPSRGDHKIPVRLYTPWNTALEAPQNGTHPLVVWVHGGGWTLGSIESDDKVARLIASRTGAMVASIEYRLAPEHKFPANLEDVLDAVHHLLDHGPAYGIDTNRVALAGESAGGHLTILSALSLLGDRPGSLCGVIPIVPATLYGCQTASCEQYATGHLLHKKHVESFWNATMPISLVNDPRISPLRAPRDVLARLPSTLVLTADQDPLRDEGEAFVDRVRSSGVATDHVRYNRTMHAFFGRISTGGKESLDLVGQWFKEKCSAPPSTTGRHNSGAVATRNIMA